MNCRVPNFKCVSFAALLVVCLSAAGFSQRNNPYSANPLTLETQDQQVASAKSAIIKGNERRATVARLATNAGRGSRKVGRPLTETYMVGIGDVLYVELKNAIGASGCYTVRSDGTIDFPLAAESPSVVQLTAEQIEALLSDAITLYPDPVVDVRVREYVSHKITVSGMAERTGERSLQREAMPLFTIRAEALVDAAAATVNIRRGRAAKVETYDLRDEQTGDVLIYPGDSVEFSADGHLTVPAPTKYFYISGEVNSFGLKPIADGMTLFQAVVASSGVKGGSGKATLRRKSEKGTLNVAEYDLRAIKDGRAADPVLLPGDMIEISN